MYNKLFAKILDSSIWLEPTPTRIVWLTFIAVMDEDGFVQFASVANVAHRAVVTAAEAEEAIRCLESPDPNSSDPEHDGRRVERVPGGWLVLNAAKHRDLVTRATIREHNRERVRRHRERTKGDDVTLGNASVTPCNGVSQSVMQSETRSETETRSDIDEEGQTATPSPSSDRLSVRAADAGKTMQRVWNDGTPAPTFPRCAEMTKAREVKCRCRLTEHPEPYWVDVVQRIVASDFCRGQNDRGWTATFDWLIANADNALKVLEGKYDNRTPVVRAAPTEPRVSDEAILADLEARRALRQRRPA